MIEKYIEAFKEIQNPQINNGEELIAWQGKAINIVSRVYGEDSVQEQQVINVKFERYSSIHVRGQTYGGGNNSKLCSKQAAEVIGGFISDLTTFGMPSKRVVEKTNGINISVNQHQHQTVEIKVIRDLIEDELTGKQVKEIEEVLKEDTSPENKKSKVLQKLKSFGSDVASSIVANILTNPNLYS